MRAPVEVYTSYIPEDIFRFIFSFLSKQTVLDMRTISKAWARVTWNYLFSQASDDYLVNYLMDWLGHSDEDFQKPWLEYDIDSKSILNFVPANSSSFLQFLNKLLTLRAEKNRLFISDTQLVFLLREIKTAKHPLSPGLLKALECNLSDSSKISVNKKLQAQVRIPLNKLIGNPSNFDAMDLQTLIFMRRNLQVAQINEVVSALTELKMASRFVYDEESLSLLVHEVTTENLVFLIKRIHVLLNENDDNCRINMFNFLKFSAKRASEQDLLSLLEYMQICFENFDLVTDISIPVRKAILFALNAIIPGLQAENKKKLLLFIKKLYWYDSDPMLHKEAMKIYVTNNIPDSYEEIMEFQDSLFMENIEYDFQYIYQKLRESEQRKYFNDHLGEILVDIQISEFVDDKIHFLEENLKFLNSQHLERILNSIRAGFGTTDKKRIEKAINLLKIISSLINESGDLQEWITGINCLVETNNPDLQLPLLELLEKTLPSFMRYEPIDLYYDYTLSILKKNDLSTQNRALSNLRLFENHLNPIQKKELLHTLTEYISENFEQVVSIIPIYLDRSNLEENTDVIKKTCAQLSPEHQLLFLEKIHYYLDRDIKDLFYFLLETKLPEKKHYVLEIVFRLIESGPTKKWDNAVLIKAIIENLEHFLLNPDENIRRSTMNKVLIILLGNFPKEVQCSIAKKFFGDKCSNMELLVVNLASQYWLKINSSDEYYFILFHTWNDLYLDLKSKPTLKSSKLTFFHSDNSALELRNEACNLVYEVLKELKGDTLKKRDFLIKLVDELQIFSGLRKTIESVRLHIENRDIGYFEEITCEAADEGFVIL